MFSTYCSCYPNCYSLNEMKKLALHNVMDITINSLKAYFEP